MPKLAFAFVLAFGSMFFMACQWTAAAADKDGDGLDDQLEADLAAKHRPIVLLNRAVSYRPVQLAAVLPGLCLEKLKGGFVIDGRKGRKEERPGFGVFVRHLREKGAAGTADMKVWSSLYNWEDGKPDPDDQPDLFWRVHPLNDDEVSLQYFWFCTFSDADILVNAGDHDGDWSCVDLTISRGDNPVVKEVIFHHHGGHSVVVKQRCEWDNERLKVYAEDNCNEPRPAAGPGNGRINRPHTGKGGEVGNWRLVSVGEKNAPGDSDEAVAFMIFEGKWGKRAEVGGDMPRSPAQQPKMWDRRPR